MNSFDSDKADIINLYDYWNVLVKYKKMILLAGAGAFVISIVISLLLPKTYVSNASILPPQQESPLNAALNGAIPGSLSGLAGSLIGSGATTTDLWIGVLNSRTVKDDIIIKFKLQDVYGKNTLEETRKALANRVSIDKSDEDIVSVSVEDKDPQRAADIANAFIEDLDRINKSTVMTSGQRMRIFVEKRLVEAREALSRVEEDLKRFQESNKAILPAEQTKAIIEAVGALKGQQMAKEVELETLLSYAAPSHPLVGLLKTEIEGLQVKLKELEAGKAAGRDIFIATDRIPKLSFQYLKLVRDAKIQETLFEFLTQQYEMARIQEAKDSPTIQVLDVATPPDKKAKPKRSVIVIFSTFAAVFSSIFFAFIREYLEKMKAFGNRL